MSRPATTRPPLLSGLLLATLAVPLAMVVPTVQASAEDGTQTCRGLPATIVGMPGAVLLTGTPGPDVVVTAGALAVDTGDGDDVVCTTDSASNVNAGVVVNTGAGADVVDTSAELRRVNTFIVPGPGADLVVGGPAVDKIVDDDVDHDTIGTGAGRDLVDLGVSATADLATVDLGAGNDEAYLHHPLQPASSIAGGAGSDQLLGPASRTGHWVFDNRLGEASRNGVVQLHWSGMEVFVPDVSDDHGSLAFLGSSADEALYADSVTLAGARMGGGDDQISIGTDTIAGSAVVSGGPGHDLVSVNPDKVRDITVDLARHTLAYVQPSGSRGSWLLTGFADAMAWAHVVHLVGDDRDNDLQYISCVADVRAGGGDDRVLFPGWAPAVCNAARATGHLAGGPGDDVLTGSPYRDTILGGPGADQALGRGGRDRCSAEKVSACEVRLP